MVVIKSAKLLYVTDYYAGYAFILFQKVLRVHQSHFMPQIPSMLLDVGAGLMHIGKLMQLILELAILLQGHQCIKVVYHMLWSLLKRLFLHLEECVSMESYRMTSWLTSK